MITLNLLSPQKKKETEEKILYISIKNILAIFLVFVLFVSIVLLGSKVILARNFQTVVEQTTLITKEYGGVNNQIKEVNNNLKDIGKVQEKFVPWSSFLIKLNKIIPENTKITAIVLRDGENQTLLKGYAKTRNDLLVLKTNLENSDLFKSVELPFSNLLKRNDIDFEFQLTLYDISKD